MRSASFALASTLVPILSVWWLRGGAGHVTEAGWLVGLRRGYGALLRPLIRLRWWVLGVYLVASGAVIWLGGQRLGWEIFPAAESGQFAFRLRAPAGTRLESTEKIALRALELIRGEAGATNISLTLGLVGVHAPNYPVNLIYLWNGGPEEAHFSVQLRAGSGRAIPSLKDRLRTIFARELPDVRVSFEPSDIVSRVMSFGSPTPIEVAVSSKADTVPSPVNP